MGAGAKRYAEETFVTEKYCRRLLNFVHQTRRNSPALDLADSMAVMLSESGLDTFPTDLPDRVAEEIGQML
jgi:hypothetical protein